MGSGNAEIRTLATAGVRLLAVCGKCSRKLDGGFGEHGSKSLSKLLKSGVANARGKRAAVRIVETKCLDICPKGAVVLVDGSSPGEILIVPRSTSLDAVAARLGLQLAS